jgi:hypothetical protein
MRNNDRASLQLDANSLPSFDGSYRLLSEGGGNIVDPLGNNLVANGQDETDSSTDNHNPDNNPSPLGLARFGGQAAFSPFAMELDPDHSYGILEDSASSPWLPDVDFPEGAKTPRIYVTTDQPFRCPASPLARTLNLNWTWGTPFVEFQNILQSQGMSLISIIFRNRFQDGHHLLRSLFYVLT